jgi:hypothetical protein
MVIHRCLVKNRLEEPAKVDIAGEHGVDAFAQQRFAEGGIAHDALLHQLLETPRQCHLLPPFSTP